MNRIEFFERPERVKDIIGEKTVYEVDASEKNTLADKIENLGKNDAILLHGSIVSPQYGTEDKFMKRGPQANLKRYRTIEEAVNDAAPMWKLRKERFGQTNKDIDYCCYGWWGIKKREYKKVHLVDCIKGAKLLAHSLMSKKPEDQITIRRYDGHSKARKKGGKYLIEVPSMTKEMKYLVNLEYVPLTRLRNKYSIIFDLSTRHGCEAFIANTFDYRYATSSIGFCPHIIAAYHKFAKEEWDSGNKTPMEVNPFAIPSKSTVDFYNKLENQVMVQESYEKDGKQLTKKRPLNKAEKEILLWKIVAKKGAMKTFFTRDSLKTYSW